MVGLICLIDSFCFREKLSLRRVLLSFIKGGPFNIAVEATFDL